MKNKQLLKTWLVAGFSALTILYSCTNEDFSEGYSLHPPSELIGIHHDSTIDVNAYSFKAGNYIYVSSEASAMFLGYANDPIIGELTYDVATHISNSPSFSYPKTGVKVDSIMNEDSTSKYIYEYFKDYIIVDSVFLYLVFNSSTGIPNSDTIGIDQELSIYEMPVEANLTLLKDQELDNININDYKKSELLADATFTPYRIPAKTKNYTDTLKIGLPIELGSKILQDTLFIGSDIILPYDDIDDFHKYIINGLYFEPNTNNDSRTTISSLAVASTKIEVKYRHFDVSTEDTIIKDTTSFSLNTSSSNKANLYHHAFNPNIKINAISAYEDSILEQNADTALYVTDNNGLYAKVMIDDIGSWDTAKNVSINKASIWLKCSEIIDTNTVFEPVRQLTINREIGNVITPLRINYASQKKYLGRYDELAYEIDFTYEMQEMIKNKERSITFLVKSSYNYSDSKRVILKSPTHETDPLQVIITYTKF